MTVGLMDMSIMYRAILPQVNNQLQSRDWKACLCVLSSAEFNSAPPVACNSHVAEPQQH